MFRAAGARPCFVHPVRNPIDVARSLARRNGFGQTRSLLMWIDHTLAVLQAAHDAPVAFVDFEALLARPSASVEGVLRRLGLGVSLSEEARQALDGAVRPALRHHRVPMAALDLDARTAAMAHALHGLMSRAAICHGPAPVLLPEMSDAWTGIVALQATPELAGFVAQLDTGWRPSAPPSSEAVAAGVNRAAALVAEAQAVLSRLQPTPEAGAPDAGPPDDPQDPAYEGQLDCLVGTVLYGWCWKRSSGDRVPLRLDLDHRDAGRAVASQFRDDLYASAIGDGWHAFAIDLNAGDAAMREDAVVRVSTEDSAFVLPGSGRTLAELRQVG